MSTSCSCLKLCSVAVALSNVCLGLYILAEGSLLLKRHIEFEDVAVGFIVVYFQMSLFLVFVGLLLLIGTIQENEKHISLYLLLSSLVWFVISTLTISYMILYNPTAMTIQQKNNSSAENNVSTTPIPSTSVPSPSEAPIPKESVPVEKAVGFSIGLVLIWCGQLGVYKFHDQVIEKHVINAGERYVSYAHHIDEN